MGKIFKAINNLFNRLYRKQVSPVPVAVFRIVFGISVGIEVIHFYYFRQLLLDPVPFLEPNPWPIGLFLIMWGMAVLFLTAGYKTKIAAVINYIFAVLFIGFWAGDYGYEWHVDSLILSGSLLLLFMPADRALSLRNFSERTAGKMNRPPTISYIYPVLLMLLLGGIYLDSVFWKITSDMYLSGLALWAPASLPFNIYHDLQWILDWKYFMIAASVIVLLYEFLFLFLVWFRPWRTIFLVLGILFHIAIGIAFPLPAFGLIMIGFLLGGLPTQGYARFMKMVGRKFEFHYDSDNLPADRQNEDTEGKKSSVPGSEFYEKMQKRTIAAYLIIWMVSLLVIHFRSPFYITYAGNMDGFWGKAYAAGNVYKAVIYPFTGFSTHGLYVDSHFAEYDYQFMLQYNGNGTEEIIPVIRRSGMAGIYNVGRNHIYWTFRTSGTGVSQPKMEDRLKRFILFWAFRNGVPVDSLRIDIYARSLEVSLDEFKKDLLHKNMNSEWEKAGLFYASGDSFSFNWFKEVR